MLRKAKNTCQEPWGLDWTPRGPARSPWARSRMERGPWLARSSVILWVLSQAGGQIPEFPPARERLLCRKSTSHDLALIYLFLPSPLAPSMSQLSGSACGSLGDPGLHGCPHHLEGSLHHRWCWSPLYLSPDSSKATSSRRPSLQPEVVLLSWSTHDTTSPPFSLLGYFLPCNWITRLFTSAYGYLLCFWNVVRPMSCVSRFLKGRSRLWLWW